MKLLSLNIWGGATGKSFLDFIKKQAKSTDIFCFQEVFSAKKNQPALVGMRTNILGGLKKILPDYFLAFSLTANRINEYLKVPFKVEEGLAIFVKKTLLIKQHKHKHLVGRTNSPVDFEKGKEVAQAQWVKIGNKNKYFWVVNFHGISQPGNKLDTTARLKQSKGLAKILKALKGPKILCGDFNLMPNTESIRIIERVGMKNLITKYKIKNTRNSISWKHYKNKQYFADFTFASPEIKAQSFKVPYVLASDHLPMVLNFNIRTYGSAVIRRTKPWPQ